MGRKSRPKAERKGRASGAMIPDDRHEAAGRIGIEDLIGLNGDKRHLAAVKWETPTDVE